MFAKGTAHTNPDAINQYLHYFFWGKIPPLKRDPLQVEYF
jgi:hypothetical protein